MFSERKGLEKVRTEIQVDSVDNTLRNRLWNLLTAYYWEGGQRGFALPVENNITSEMSSFLSSLWHNYFKWSFDSLSYRFEYNLDKIRDYFFKCQWFKVYDFIEFVANRYPSEIKKDKFIQACNVVLENELSAYRFVGGLITQLTSKEEISEIETASKTPYEMINAHIKNALRLMSDKKSPDYSNSIKESISAIEGTCRLIANKENATLGEALDIIEKEGRIELHGALKRAFDSLYGFTSSAQGIRHARTGEKMSLSFEDAKFMLVSCSAFVNYLISKASKVGIMQKPSV